MNLDKYRRTTSIQPENGVSSTDSSPIQPPEAPALGGNAESILQKASRYRSFVYEETRANGQTGADNNPTVAPNLPQRELSSMPGPPTAPEPAKGNRFKSKPGATSLRKQASRLPGQSKKREPSPLTGVKIVYLDETMRDEYIQIAGYLMLNYRVRLTMTAYFCFLHDQAVTRQSDPAFLDALVQFTKRTPESNTP